MEMLEKFWGELTLAGLLGGAYAIGQAHRKILELTEWKSSQEFQFRAMSKKLSELEGDKVDIKHLLKAIDELREDTKEQLAEIRKDIREIRAAQKTGVRVAAAGDSG